jgi:predicted O-methyltransferase YrrM
MLGAARERKDSLDLRINGHDVWPGPGGLYHSRNALTLDWLDYVSRVSTANWAVSLETAAYLFWWCDRFSPKRILNTGSGFSSFVLHRYGLQSGAEVYSIDNDDEWLEKTAHFLTDRSIPTDNVLPWSETIEGRFDLVFHDGGDLQYRVETMAAVSNLASDDGVIVYDDIHYPTVRREAERVTSQGNRRLFSLRSVTLDEIGRFCGIAVSSPFRIP